MSLFDSKKVLVTGGTGLIGRPLVEMLLEQGARVRVASLDDSRRAHLKAEFRRVDLTLLDNCLDVCRGMDIVFHLASIKGSPQIVLKKPASFFFPIVSINTNMLEAARRCNVTHYLYTSSIGVYEPSEVFYEDQMWAGFPSKNDWYSGWAKRVGELQVEAYALEYAWDKISIVRPANVYGPFDNFDASNAMVIPSLIKRALDGENPFTVWGDGSPVRDFIHARDVARGMMMVLEKGVQKPVNLGSGRGYSIKEVVEIILDNLDVKPRVVWDTSKPAGDKKRLMDISRAESIGFKPEISLEEGIKEMMQWYRTHREKSGQQYNVFSAHA